MSGGLTLTAAFVLGLLASGHCVLMCGGISGALMLAGGAVPGRPPLRLQLAQQLGRITSYMVAAVLLAGAGAALVRFVDQQQVRTLLRILSAAAFAAVGLAMLGKVRGIDAGIGRLLWPHIAPLARPLLPARHFWQAFALGSIWGWMPCGFVYSVLLIAWLSLDPLRSAATMLLFGLGTMPALLAANYGLSGALRVFGRKGTRSAMAVALLLMAVLTIAGPWIVAHTGAHVAGWLPLECATGSPRG
jgi:sulfite exporter TauE/SafE